jgi:hypothetical protein
MMIVPVKRSASFLESPSALKLRKTPDLSTFSLRNALDLSIAEPEHSATWRLTSLTH